MSSMKGGNQLVNHLYSLRMKGHKHNYCNTKLNENVAHL